MRSGFTCVVSQFQPHFDVRNASFFERIADDNVALLFVKVRDPLLGVKDTESGILFAFL